MDGLTIDRHKIVPTFSWEDLTKEDQSEFDGQMSEGVFFFYLDRLYCDLDFMPFSAQGFEGILSDTFFSGTFIKFSEDFETVDCARYYA